jgi:uncharacterized protein DUF4388
VPAHDTIIRGRLKALSIADILLFLRGLNRAGRLAARRAQEEVVLDLRGPYIVRVASTRPVDRLEEVLVATGRIAADQAEDLRARAAAHPEVGIGRALIASGLLTPRELVAARRDQARRVVLALFDWPEGEYRFDDGRTTSGWTTPVDLPILDLVVDGIRRAETALFAERLPSPDWVFDAGEGAGDVPLEPHEERILSLLDGRRTIAEVEALVEFTADETRRVLFLLLTIGRIRPRSQAATDAGEPLEDIVRRFNGIYGRVYQYMTIELGPISDNLLNAPLAELDGSHAPLFARARLAGDGTLDGGLIEANLRGLARARRREALVDGLNELLYRQLLVLRRTLGPEHERRVLHELRREGLLAGAGATGHAALERRAET